MPSKKRNTGSNATSQLVSIRLPRAMVARLKARAEALEIGYQTVLKELLQTALDETPDPVVPEGQSEEGTPEEGSQAVETTQNEGDAPGISDADIDDMLDGV